MQVVKPGTEYLSYHNTYILKLLISQDYLASETILKETFHPLHIYSSQGSVKQSLIFLQNEKFTR